MIVRSQQMEVFQESLDSELVDVIMRDLDTHNPGVIAGLPEPEFRRRIRIGLAYARAYQLDTKFAAALFVELMFLEAPNFFAYPPIRAALERFDQAANVRMKSIVRNTTEAQWIGVQRRSDQTVWTAGAPPVR